MLSLHAALTLCAQAVGWLNGPQDAVVVVAENAWLNDARNAVVLAENVWLEGSRNAIALAKNVSVSLDVATLFMVMPHADLWNFNDGPTNSSSFIPSYFASPRGPNDIVKPGNDSMPLQPTGRSHSHTQHFLDIHLEVNSVPAAATSNVDAYLASCRRFNETKCDLRDPLVPDTRTIRRAFVRLIYLIVCAFHVGTFCVSPGFKYSWSFIVLDIISALCVGVTFGHAISLASLSCGEDLAGLVALVVAVSQAAISYKSFSQESQNSSDSDTAPLGDKQGKGQGELCTHASYGKDEPVASRVIDSPSTQNMQAGGFADDADPESPKPVDKGKGKELTFKPITEVRTNVTVSSVSLSGDAATSSAPAPPLDDIASVMVGNASSLSRADVNGNDAISTSVYSSSSFSEADGSRVDVESMQACVAITVGNASSSSHGDVNGNDMISSPVPSSPSVPSSSSFPEVNDSRVDEESVESCAKVSVRNASHSDVSGNDAISAPAPVPSSAPEPILSFPEVNDPRVNEASVQACAVVAVGNASSSSRSDASGNDAISASVPSSVPSSSSSSSSSFSEANGLRVDVENVQALRNELPDDAAKATIPSITSSSDSPASGSAINCAPVAQAAGPSTGHVIERDGEVGGNLVSIHSKCLQVQCRRRQWICDQEFGV